ncbi:galactose oxidase [Streptomyces sp. Ru73]|uniref:galactose oxidase early set domain-containing protein n=1 Tax=Streptomyces sp. Ru73 TaxID=2080748 RepID=UPI000CDD6B7D|nr:galactose oxidase early set domain-containing protein [Streptomyces sp. Ru73]POX42379.1 galactose oxidase [Streptomyces sp. Ru73]
MARRRTRFKERKTWLGIGAVLVLAAFNAPAATGFAERVYHDYAINRDAYKAENGHWDVLDVPPEFRQNTIHAALLRTGKVLLVAGSGNNVKNFDAKRFTSVLWDPVRNSFKKIHTPNDLFCTGHIHLADGKLLFAGGTKRYEKLKGDVTKAGGLMIVHNENPNEPVRLPAGTVFTGRRNHRTFVAKDPIRIRPAKKVFDKETGRFLRTEASVDRIYVEARKKGRQYEAGAQDNYRVRGLTRARAHNVYGIATKLGLDKKDFQGIHDAYEFDPLAEKFTKVQSMHEARWYPTLVRLSDGRVLALSGLDDIGQVVPGKSEIYDPKSRTWAYSGKVRQFPTYPAVFPLSDGTLFYSGSNAGYGPADVGRTPGIWHFRTNTFTKLPGLDDAGLMETSGTVLLPPAQRQKFMVVGGGGIGESAKSSKKTRLIDLTQPHPSFHDGPSLDEGTRYPILSVLPDDTVLVTGGSKDYRGPVAENILQARLYDARSGTMRRVADPQVGRNYHSGAILLPDGRVLTFGGDSLFADKAKTQTGTFEQRLEVYTPPYLYRGARPALSHGPTTVGRGATAVFRTKDAAAVKTARLLHPSSTTHVTDVEQRSVALDFTRTKSGDGIEVTLPKNRNLVPSGWYMLFVTNRQGTPSTARWVKVP